MRLWASYIIVFAIEILSFIALIGAAPNPESTILGEWEELKWEYEKVDKGNGYHVSEKNYNPNELKSVIGQHLVIHEAEKWIFMPNGQLKLIDGKSARTVNWYIKGLGNLLQVKYDDDKIENYNITVLNHDELILNFDTDVHARGIAKLTFTKRDK